LKLLKIDNNYIKDLNPLLSLTGLTNLYLDNNFIEDISPLLYFSNLYDLSLKNNNIKDNDNNRKIINKLKFKLKYFDF